METLDIDTGITTSELKKPELKKKVMGMISELLALTVGAFTASVITASLYRSNQAANLRRAIANVTKYLESRPEKPLGNANQKLRFHLELINEADDLVARSAWAKEQKRRFVRSAVEVIRLRNKGASRDSVMDRMAVARESGELLLGYFLFPSWLWCKATLARLSSRYTAQRKARSTTGQSFQAFPEKVLNRRNASRRPGLR